MLTENMTDLGPKPAQHILLQASHTLKAFSERYTLLCGETE